jgi:hypothetical protein
MTHRTARLITVCQTLILSLFEGNQLTAEPQPPAQEARSVQVGQGARWTSIGPTGTSLPQNSSTAVPWTSGRVQAVAVDPGNASHWLIGAAAGGVWETVDAGATWAPKTDNQASLAMGRIAFAPSSPNVTYAGTGEFGGLIGNVCYYGAGLLKSTDGSTTWTLLAPATFAGTTFTSLRVHVTNPDIVLAATAPGVAGRAWIPIPSAPPTGILKSTDGGATWALKLVGWGTDLDIDPTNFDHQFAGIGNVIGDPANGVYRSTDGGETWTRITGPWDNALVGRIALAIAPSNPNTIYVSVQKASSSLNSILGQGSEFLGLFRTDNAWAPAPTWTPIRNADGAFNGTGGFCTSGCHWAMALLVDRANADTLYAAGTQGVWRCATCGALPTWTNLGSGADNHALAWAGDRLVVGNDAGVWSATDVCGFWGCWENHNTNLVIGNMFNGALHPTESNFAVAGGVDGVGSRNWTGSNTWGLLEIGDLAEVAISTTRPDTDWALWGTGRQGGGPYRTTDGGRSFVLANGGADAAQPFVPRLKKCPASDDVLLMGKDQLWRSDNFFSAPNPFWVLNSKEADLAQFTALAFAPSDPTCSTYAFGTLDGRLRLTVNGGKTWVDLDPGNAVPNRTVTNLAFDPTNPNVLYVTLSGFDESAPGQPGHLFKTTNALAAPPAWANVSPPVNLPNNTVVVDPTNSSIVYVGADVGVWKSTDGATTWTHMGPETGMPNVVVSDLKINPTTNRLVAFTFGRGAFVTAAQVPALVAAVLPSSRSVQVGHPATAFATVINAGAVMATGVGISNPGLPATFSYQTTDPTTNAVSGQPNTPADIPPGKYQTYVLALTPTAPFAPTDVAFTFAGTNADPAPMFSGIDTLLLSASTAPVPDIVALVATAANDGIVNLPGATGAGAFAVATVNVGASASITVSADTGSGNPPVGLQLCQTNPATGHCTSAIGPNATTQINAGETPTFAVFVQGQATVPFDPAQSRVFVRFKDAGSVTRGSTSVAVRTQ